MKYSYIFVVAMFLTWGCSKYNAVNRNYSYFKEKNIQKFTGYRFVADSLGDIRDVKSKYIEIDSNWYKAEVLVPNVNKFRRKGQIQLPELSLDIFNSLPLYDTSVNFTKKELYTINRLMEINEILLQDTNNLKFYKNTVDSIIKSEDFKSYQKKEESRKKILVILYPALVHKDKMILACRLYHTGMTSDAGSMIYQEFSKY